MELRLDRESEKVRNVVSSHGVVGLERQGAMFNFVIFIAGILVSIRKPKDDIALGLLRYRDDSG